MAPITRAALRSNTAVLDTSKSDDNNSTTNAAAVISETSTTARPVLGEVAGNNNSDLSTAPNDLSVQDVGPAKIPPATKGNSGKRGKGTPTTVDAIEEDTEKDTAVLPDEENHPRQEEKVDGIPEAALSQGRQKGVGMPSIPDDNGSLNVQSPPGQSTEDRLRLSQFKTPQFDPNVHVSPATDQMAEDSEDSFVKSIVSRSPRRLGDDEDLTGTREYSLSPTRQSARIEDSVEAIDALEEALEQVGQALPNVDNGFDSPVRGPSPTEPVDQVEVPKKAHSTSGGKTSVLSVRNKRVEPKGKDTKPQPTARRSVAAQPPQTQTHRNAPRVTSRAQTTRPPVRPVSPTKQPTATTPGVAKRASKPPAATTAKESKTPTTGQEKLRVDPRHLSTSKPGFVPARSTKAPTRPTFELPGEAISRRMKAQREEKARQEEEARQRQREFKARPVRISSVPSVAVKGTASSRNRARASLVGADMADNSAPQSPAASQRHSALITPPRSSSLQSVGRAASNRNSLLGLSQRSSFTSLATRTSSTSRAPAAGSPTISVSHPESEGDAHGAVVTPTRPAEMVPPATAASLKARGKEIFERDRLLNEERAQARREKEAAATRARADAAERGRQASREWAERQRLKKAGT